MDAPKALHCGQLANSGGRYQTKEMEITLKLKAKANSRSINGEREEQSESSDDTPRLIGLVLIILRGIVHDKILKNIFQILRGFHLGDDLPNSA